MLVLFLAEVISSSTASIGFCEDSKCNFPTEFGGLIIDPFQSESQAQIEETVTKYIKIATDVEIYFNVNELLNNLNFSLSLSIFLGKNLSMRKLEGQMSPNNITFTIDSRNNYSNTGIYIYNLLIQFILLGFSNENYKLTFNELYYISNYGDNFQLFPNGENYMELSGNKIILNEEIIFNFQKVTLKNPQTPFYLQISNNILIDFFVGNFTVSNKINVVLVSHLIQQKISFTSIDENSILSLKSEDAYSIYQLPKITIFDIFIVKIEGEWPEAGIVEINNYLYVPELTEFGLDGDVVINSPQVPFNICGNVIDIYFGVNSSKICGKVVTNETNLYIDYKKDITVSLEIERHENGVINVFNSNFTITINYLQYEFTDDANTFPVIIGFSNTEISHVRILYTDFNKVTQTVDYISLINLMTRNPQILDDIDFVLGGSDYFLIIPFVSFFYFVDLELIYYDYSNLVHGFKNGVNTLHYSYFVDYSLNIVKIATYGEPPMYIPVVLCLAKQRKDCEKVSGFYYYVKAGTRLDDSPYVTDDFSFYYVHVIVNDTIDICMQKLERLYFSFQFNLHGAKVNFTLPENPISLYNLTIINGTLVTDTDIAYQYIYFQNIAFAEDVSITFGDDDFHFQTDLDSMDIIHHAQYIPRLTLKDNDEFSYKIEITDDQLIINSIKIPWELVGRISVHGFEFILENNATNIYGFDLVSMADDSVVQFNGNYKDLKIRDKINFFSRSYSSIIYIYQPYLNPKIKFILSDKYIYVISYIYSVSYCIYLDNSTNETVCPDSYIKKSYLELNDLANTTASRIEIYFDNYFESNNKYVYLDLNRFNSKELYLYSYKNYIKLNVTLPNKTLDLKFTSFTFQNVEIYIIYDYVGQHISTSFGYLSLVGKSAFMNGENASVIIDHFYGRFFNLRDWDSIKINKECYLYSFNVNVPYALYFVKQRKLKNRLNFYLEDTKNDRLMIFGDKKIYYNNGVYYLPDKEKFEVNIFINDPHHTIKFDCNETGDLPNINIVFHSSGPVYFTGLWYQNNLYQINLHIDRDVLILIEYEINLNIYGSGSPNIISATLESAVLGEIVLSQRGGEIPTVLGLNSIYQRYDMYVTKIRIESLKYMFDKDYQSIFSAAVLFGTSINATIVNLGYVGVPQQGFDFIFYMDNLGVSRINLIEPIKKMKLSDIISVYLNLSGNIDNEEDYEILQKNLSILVVPSENSYFKFELDLILSSHSLSHGFPQIVQLQKTQQIIPGYTAFSLYTNKSPLQIPYTVQFAVDGYFFDVDVKIFQYQKIETAFDSVPFKIKHIEFIASSVIPENYPIKISTIDSKYNNTIFEIITTMSGITTLFIDKPGEGVETLKLMGIKLKKSREVDQIFGNIKSLWLSESEIDDHALRGIETLRFLHADIWSFNELTRKQVTFTGLTNLNIRGITGIIFGSDFWIINYEDFTDNIRTKVIAKQFKSVIIKTNEDIDFQLSSDINQTSISGITISFDPGNNFIGEISLKFGMKWKHIMNMSLLHIISDAPLRVLTMTRPLSFQVSAPALKIEFDPNSSEQFEISDPVISHSFEMDLTQFPPEQQIVRGEIIRISDQVNITFKDEIGQIETKMLLILDDAQVTIGNISVLTLISLSPGATVEIDELMIQKDTQIELHWNIFAFPLLSINSTAYSDNISLILDDNNPNFDAMNDLLYNKKTTIISGNFDCEKWNWKFSMISASPYYRTGPSNVLMFQCLQEHDTWSLLLYSYKNVTIEDSILHPSPKGSSIVLISGFSVAAVILVVIVSISLYYLCRDARKVKLRDQRREIREKLTKLEKKPPKVKPKVEKIASSSYDDLTSFSFSDSYETEDNDKLMKNRS